MLDYLPDHFVVLHGGKLVLCCESWRVIGAVSGCFVE